MKKLREIADTLAKINDKQLMEKLLKGLFTIGELRTVCLRWELLKLLEKGMSQRAIAKKLGVSLCKITRGSRELKKQNSALKKVIKTYCLSS
jgi:TrpR family trp operon transcriptional repressor